MKKRIRNKQIKLACCSHCDFIKDHEYDEAMVCNLKTRYITFSNDCLNCKHYICNKKTLQSQRKFMKEMDKYLHITYPEDYVPF